jgi:hypothetical protein
MHPITPRGPAHKPGIVPTIYLPTVRAVCPDCHTASTVSPVHVTEVYGVLYHSCFRCHLVWGTDFAGRPMNKH